MAANSYSDVYRETFANESLFGEWCALAADHTQTPDQLTSITAGGTAVDYRIFARIAMTNYRHFHPAVVTSWRAEHLKSLDASVGASKLDGIALIDAYESALAVQAFAEHYLQDSFSAGHMGFNRVASSNATAMAYHNAANKHGRCVMNLRGVAWYTYGDDHLGGVGFSHVREASEASLIEFIETFVVGQIDTKRWQEVWFRLPAYIDEADTTDERSCVPSNRFKSLRSINKPAEAVTTFDISMVSDVTLDRNGPAVQGIMYGASREFTLTIPLGYRSIQNRIFGAIGASTRQRGPRGLLLDYGYLWHVATTNNGLVTHEVGFGQDLFIASHGNDRRGSDRLLYALNVEAGRVYIRVQTALAHRLGHYEPHLSIGLGWVGRSQD